MSGCARCKLALVARVHRAVEAREDDVLEFGIAGQHVEYGSRGDADGVVGGGVHLSPNELHELMAQRGDDVVFFDGRNKFEAEIGRFRNAVVPDVATTRDFVSELDSGRYDHLKAKPVVTYCTGGVRCEVLSALMRNRGFEQVYQLDGGIVRYGEAFGDEGLWDGSLYVFDKRMNLDFTDKAITLGQCTLCQAPTSRYRNHPDVNGRELTLVCETCVPDA